ncbi:TPA: hypothetical protein TVK02_000384 [Streptococcus equi subsp. zooepidemicus]|nr:hypothetical protein [Streptococcus equi subsp. zooepidemicus]HEL1132039.1 hypothetical protein [Streptococcus equi subsp. zooepidemicus]
MTYEELKKWLDEQEKLALDAMLEGASYSKEQMEGVFSSLYNTISCINMMLHDNELTYKSKQK